MGETSSDLLFWAVVVVFTSPIWFALGWEIVEGFIRPHLIPSKEIERLATETMQRYPDNPLGAAGREEHAAWYRSESYEQGKWRRVRKAIARRLSEKDNA